MYTHPLLPEEVISVSNCQIESAFYIHLMTIVGKSENLGTRFPAFFSGKARKNIHNQKNTPKVKFFKKLKSSNKEILTSFWFKNLEKYSVKPGSWRQNHFLQLFR